jgi:membrane protease YdiL (CAAX protease family)
VFVENREIQNVNEPLSRDLKNLSTTAYVPTPDDPPWSSGAAFLVWLASVAFILIFPSIAIVGYLAASGLTFTDQAQLVEILKNDINASLVQILAILPAHLFTLLLAWAVVTRFNRFSFRETLGWQFNNFRVWHIIILLVPIFILAGALTAYFGEQDNEMLKILRSSYSARLLVAIMATLTAPIVEEVIYRGVLYSALQRTVGVTTAVFLVTLLFAVVHVPQYLPDFVSISLICLLSLILTLVRVWTNNLLPCIVLHFVFNGIQSVILLIEPYVMKTQ